MILQILIMLIIIYFLMILYRDLYIFPKIIKICREKQAYLKLILPIIINKLNQYNITYFIVGGTLLGYKRHNKKFIPWDDDIDLVIIYTNDLDKKIQMISNDIKDEFVIENIFFGYKVINKYNNSFIDLFVYYEEGEKIKSKSTKCLFLWPNDYFIYSETFPLIKDKFEDIDVYIPNNYDIYLKRQYGNYKKWDLTHNHYCNVFENAIIYLTKFTKQTF